ncbi:MAG: ATP-binding protein [Desulfocapsaceae bacterium]|nr:ATP-binding protein [Desulfocapsaceae bacterium]
MNEIEGLKWHLGRYQAILAQQIDRLYNALEELQRTTLMLIDNDNSSDEAIDSWLASEDFSVDNEGFFQSQILLEQFRKGEAPADAISFSWGQQLRKETLARKRIYIHRNIGAHLKHIHDRLGDVGWIYYQDASNTSLQYPFIDQRSAITSDFDWSTYHTYVSVSPENNPDRKIQWTPPTIDYAGEGLIVSVSIPVWLNDEFIGLWSIDIPLRYLYRDFTTSNLFPQNNQFITDCRGMLVLHEHLQAKIDQTKGSVFLRSIAEMGGEWHNLDFHKIAKAEEGELIIADQAGTEWIYRFKSAPEVDWVLFCGMPKSAMEEAAAQRLSRAFKEIAEGNFSHRIEEVSSNALHVLIDEFNVMTTRLSKAEERRQEVESQLRHAQKMEAVGRLAGGVAHDYNNMINVIMGYTEMALEKVSSNDLLHTYLQEINEAAKRSMELTRQLLAFARRQNIIPRLLDINQTVTGMLKMLQRMIGENIEVSWKPGANIWLTKIDPSQIDQILANLCVNARDAIDGAGQLQIATTNAELDVAFCSRHPGFKPGQYVQLTVSDNGTGIDEQVLDKIFEPFFSTKAIGRGTGLGLATVYGIVKQNEGYVSVESEPGEGTTFTIYLPRITEQLDELQKHPAKRTATAGNGETILVVEDEQAVLNLTEKMLKKLGYQVIAETSPFSAISLAQKHEGSIDLLLTDVIMPELSGRELAKRIQTIRPQIGVLFTSGYTDDVMADHGILVDNISFIEKPFSTTQLSEKLGEVLNCASNDSSSALH